MTHNVLLCALATQIRISPGKTHWRQCCMRIESMSAFKALGAFNQTALRSIHQMKLHVLEDFREINESSILQCLCPLLYVQAKSWDIIKLCNMVR